MILAVFLIWFFGLIITWPVFAIHIYYNDALATRESAVMATLVPALIWPLALIGIVVTVVVKAATRND